MHSLHVHTTVVMAVFFILISLLEKNNLYADAEERSLAKNLVVERISQLHDMTTTQRFNKTHSLLMTEQPTPLPRCPPYKEKWKTKPPGL